jgi:predicted chitinase
MEWAMRAQEFIVESNVPDIDEGWKEKAAAGAIALGSLGATGDAAAKEKETWIQSRKPAVQTAMAPAAKFDSTKTLAKAPVAKAPVAKAAVTTPVQKAPPVDASTMNILSFHNPEAEEVLHRAAKSAGIKGTELAQFMAQTRHESADFSRMKELGGDKYFNKLYDPKTSPRTAKILGNTKVGDGIRYHGRGFIQITGRDNYRMAGEALGLPLEQHPELASKPAIAAKIAVWYWKTRVKPYVKNFADTASVTKKINPAMRGLQDRQLYFQDYRKII